MQLRIAIRNGENEATILAERKLARKWNGVPGVSQNAMLSINLQNSDLVANDIVNEQEIA